MGNNMEMSARKTASEVKTSNVRVRRMTQIGMLSAIAVVLMLFEVPMPFAPAFYKLDLSEVPVLIGCFAMGPLAGAIIELVKILLNFIMDGTVTAGVGEMANLIIGCSFCVPAGILYRRKKTKRCAIIGLTVGTICMVVVGCFVNAYVLLPAYANAFHMPIESLVEMGSVINGNITNIFTFVIFVVAPFNLVKGIVVSTVVLVSYKRVKKGTGMI